MTNKVIVGSRKSKLAMAQTKLVIASLEKLFPEIEFEIKNVITEGIATGMLVLPKSAGKVFLLKRLKTN